MSDLDLFTMALFIAALTLSAYVLLMGIARMVGPIRRAAFHARFGFAAPFVAAVNELNRDDRFEQLEEEVRQALGEDETWGERERIEIVNAAVASQQIAVIDRRLRETVDQCLRTHWAVAKGLGAVEMAEAARHPLSSRLRQRVIDLADLLNQRLISYPLLLDSPKLIQLQIGLRWIPATCVACPYRTTAVANAPQICPTAKAMGRDRASTNSAVRDAEVVDDSGDVR